MRLFTNRRPSMTTSGNDPKLVRFVDLRVQVLPMDYDLSAGSVIVGEIGSLVIAGNNRNLIS